MTVYKLIGSPPLDLFKKISFTNDEQLKLVTNALFHSVRKMFPDWTYSDMVNNCKLLKNDVEIKFPE